jgi:hypothetical protein
LPGRRIGQRLVLPSAHSGAEALMTTHFGPYPDFSWSGSRDDVWSSCERRYFHQYYHSWLGWSADPSVSDSQRAAYRLKHLTSLHGELGVAVHALCEERVTAMRDGERWIGTAAAVEERLRLALRKACVASRDRAGYLRRPKNHGMLQSVYYTGRYDAREVEAVRRKMGACARYIVGHPVWEELGALPPEAFRAVECLDGLTLEGTKVWVKADLIYEADDRRTVFADWKTRSDDDYPVRPQIALYALYARDVLGIPWREGEWIGRVINLVTGRDHCFELTQVDLARAEKRVRESVAGMRQLLEDEALNRPMPMEHFPLAPQPLRWRCPHCPFFQLCADELGGTQCRGARESAALVGAGQGEQERGSAGGAS